MKTFGILISALSIAAGIVVGRLEYENERKTRGVDADSLPSRNASSPAENQSAAASERGHPPGSRKAPPRGYTPSPEDIVGGTPQVTTIAPEAKPSVPATAEPTLAAGEPSSYKDRLEKVERLINEQEFDKANREANELVEMTRRASPTVHVRALKLKAKARVFDSLLQNVPRSAQGDGSGERVEEVLLANRNTIVAKRVEKEVDHYVIHLPNGVVYRPPAEEVLEVRPVPHAAYLESQWHELEGRVAKLTNPIDLFVLGVEECYQRGLKKEGLVLLERLLAHPDSDQIPLLFCADAGESMLQDWRIAAGRVSAEEIVALAGGPAPSPGGGRAAADAAPGAPVRAAPGIANPEALVQVSRLLGEAQALYQNAATKEGREGELAEARKRLDRAFQLLEPLPADETVKKLRRQLSQLLSDVVRVLPF